MSLGLNDFFPSYPLLQSDKKLPRIIFRLKEFNKLKLESYENVPTEKGEYMNHQKIIKRLVSPYTLINKLLLVHATGTGKSCAATAVTENFLNSYLIKTNRKVTIFLKNNTLIKNFADEIAKKCTNNKYLVDGKVKYSLIKKSYEFHTFAFLKVIASRMQKDKNNLIKEYSNRIIVIDEAHVLRDYDEEGTNKKYDYYKIMKNFIKMLKNIKVLLLTATPIVDQVYEISDLFNLIIDNELPSGDNFLKHYFDKNKFIESRKQEFINSVGNFVSYIRPLSSSLKVNIEGKIIKPLQYTTVFPINASEFQTKYILEASKKKQAFKNLERQASLMVFPDGTYGTKALTTYTTYSIKNNSPWLFKSQYIKDIIENLEKYSCKLNFVVKNILQFPQKVHYIYSNFVAAGGMILGAILNYYGYKYITKNTPLTANLDKKIAVLSSFTDDNLILKIKRFMSENIGTIKIIIGGPKVSMGISFKQVDFVYDLFSPWNMSGQEQAFGRAIRADSHTPNSTITIYRLVAIYDTNKIPSDISIYRLAENKDIKNQQVYRLIKIGAVDCLLNKKRNLLDIDVDYSKTCNYQKCYYTCNKEEKLDNLKMIDTNYNLLYGDDYISKTTLKILDKLKNTSVEISNNKSSRILIYRIVKQIFEKRITYDDYNFIKLINYHKNKLYTVFRNNDIDILNLFTIKDSKNLESIIKFFNYRTDKKILSSCNGDNLKLIVNNLSTDSKIKILEQIYLILNFEKINNRQKDILENIFKSYKSYFSKDKNLIYNTLYELHFKYHNLFELNLSKNISVLQNNVWVRNNNLVKQRKVEKPKAIVKITDTEQYKRLYSDDSVHIFGYRKNGELFVIMKNEGYKRLPTGINCKTSKIDILNKYLKLIDPEIETISSKTQLCTTLEKLMEQNNLIIDYVSE